MKFWAGHFSLALAVIVLSQSVCFGYETLEINYKGRKQIVHYDYYVPSGITEGEKVPVLVCAGGLPIYDGVFAHSNTQECLTDVWKKFADQNHLAVLGLGFLFIESDWQSKESYQYAKVWSGRALDAILKKFKRQLPIDSNKIFMYGVSAGAQFSIRFAQMKPKRVIAVTAHASGGYDIPKRFIPVKFLLTVGDQDILETPRLELAKEFTALSQKKKIDLKLEIIKGLGHRQTFEQDEMSRAFIKENLNRINNLGR